MSAGDDRAAITALVMGYAERIDGGDLAGVAALFADATYGGAQAGYRGAAAVREVLESRVILYDGLPRTKHVTTNLVIELDGETAAARSYFTVLQATPELPLQTIIAGRYDDRFARTAGVWRFTARVIHIDLVGDLRFHLR
jgi:hypothetical protein